MTETIPSDKNLAAVTICGKKESKVKRINLKLIMLNQLQWISAILKIENFLAVSEISNLLKFISNLVKLQEHFQ